MPFHKQIQCSFTQNSLTRYRHLSAPLVATLRQKKFLHKRQLCHPWANGATVYIRSPGLRQRTDNGRSSQLRVEKWSPPNTASGKLACSYITSGSKQRTGSERHRKTNPNRPPSHAVTTSPSTTVHKTDSHTHSKRESQKENHPTVCWNRLRQAMENVALIRFVACRYASFFGCKRA